MDVGRRAVIKLLALGALSLSEVAALWRKLARADDAAAELEKCALRERNRTTYRVTAAGVHYDHIDPSDVIEMFLTILYYAAKAARAIGYEYLEAWAPWDRHPKMVRKWTDYPGC